MKTTTPRRAFLGLGAGPLLLSAAPPDRSYQANQNLIGAGGRGKWFVDTVPKTQNLVALCDVDDSKATYARSELPKVPYFHDFRVLLEKMNREIDGVIVATPDHTHAAASLAARKRRDPVSGTPGVRPDPGASGQQPRGRRPGARRAAERLGILTRGTPP